MLVVMQNTAPGRGAADPFLTLTTPGAMLFLDHSRTRPRRETTIESRAVPRAMATVRLAAPRPSPRASKLMESLVAPSET